MNIENFACAQTVMRVRRGLSRRVSITRLTASLDFFGHFLEICAHIHVVQATLQVTTSQSGHHIPFNDPEVRLLLSPITSEGEWRGGHKLYQPRVT